MYPLGKDRKWERERLKRLKKKRKGKTEIKRMGQRKKVRYCREEEMKVSMRKRMIDRVVVQIIVVFIIIFNLYKY